MSRSPSAPVVFSSAAAVAAHPWVGVFSADSAAVAAVHLFAARPDVPLSDRAAALRSMGRLAYGLDDSELGLDLSDADFVASALL